MAPQVERQAAEMAEPSLAPLASWMRRNIRNRLRHQDDSLIKLHHSPRLLDKLTCSFCRKYLSVGPIHCETTRGLRACGRCVKQPTAEVRACEMQPDRLYGSLLRYFVFKCSYKSCEEKLKWHQVEHHEARCIHRLQIQDHESTDSGNEDEAIFVKIPNVRLIHQKLSCNWCRKSLSVFPVMSNGQVTICGRCERLAHGNWTEQVVYSDMVKFLKFDCKNVYCNDVLKIDEIEEHERNCRWKLMWCPCRRRILAPEMSLHVRSDHLDECPDRLEVKEQRSLFKVDNEPYIVSVEPADERRFSCAVYGLDDMDYDSLLLEIVDENSVESLEIKVAKLQQQTPNRVLFNDRQNAFIRLVRVGIVETCGIALDEESSERFECKVCYLHMTRAIFVCENNHAICDRCKSRVASCPTCRGALADRRHATMETEAADLRFPCPWRALNGCDVALTPKSLARHEVRCRPPGCAPSESCLLSGCHVKQHSRQYDDVFNHFAKHHAAGLVIYPGRKEMMAWTSTEDQFFIKSRALFFDGECFLLTMYRVEENSCVYCIIQKATGTGCKKYKYTLELDGDGRTVEMKGTCCPYLPMEIVEVTVKADVVASMVQSRSGEQQNGATISWLDYRVKLEENFDT